MNTLNVQTKKIGELKSQNGQVIIGGDIHSKNYLSNEISTNGVITPIIIDKDNNIIDGHRRVEICKEKNITEIQTIVFDNKNGVSLEELKIRLEFSQKRLTFINILILTNKDKKLYEEKYPESIKKEISKKNLKSKGTKEKEEDKVPCYTEFSSNIFKNNIRTQQNRVQYGLLFENLCEEYQNTLIDIDKNSTIQKNVVENILNLSNEQSKLFFEIIQSVDTSDIDNKILKETLKEIKTPHIEESNTNDTNSTYENEDEILEEVEEFDNELFKSILKYDIESYFKIEHSEDTKDLSEVKEELNIEFTEEIKYLEQIIREKVLEELRGEK